MTDLYKLGDVIDFDGEPGKCTGILRMAEKTVYIFQGPGHWLDCWFKSKELHHRPDTWLGRLFA